MTSKRIIDEFNRKAAALEQRSKQFREPEKESDEDKERRFKRLRDARKEEMKHRERRHYWWDPHKDEVHCYYFPRDFPSDEEISWYKHVLELQKKGEFEGFLYHSTSDAIIEWITDDAYLEMDKIAFPNHKHGPWDFYHDQLFDQEYYKEDMKSENRDRFLQGSPTAYPYRDKMKEIEH